jgi:hypothetical protein
MTKDEFLAKYKINYKYTTAPFAPGIIIASIEDILNPDAKDVVYFYKDAEGITNISIDIEEEYISSSINIVVNNPIEKIVFVPLVPSVKGDLYLRSQLKIQGELA